MAPLARVLNGRALGGFGIALSSKSVPTHPVQLGREKGDPESRLRTVPNSSHVDRAPLGRLGYERSLGGDSPRLEHVKWTAAVAGPQGPPLRMSIALLGEIHRAGSAANINRRRWVADHLWN